MFHKKGHASETDLLTIKPSVNKRFVELYLAHGLKPKEFERLYGKDMERLGLNPNGVTLGLSPQKQDKSEKRVWKFGSSRKTYYFCTRKSVIRPLGAIAQLVEQRTENPCVPGSIPGGTTTTHPGCTQTHPQQKKKKKKKKKKKEAFK